MELATLCFHKPFNVEMIKAMVERQTGVHNIPDWLVRGSLEQMRQKKILFITDGMFINSNWLDSIAPLAPLLLPSGSPVHWSLHWNDEDIEEPSAKRVKKARISFDKVVRKCTLDWEVLANEE